MQAVAKALTTDSHCIIPLLMGNLRTTVFHKRQQTPQVLIVDGVWVEI
ncbi:MAG: hypothetical protein AAFX01_14405 [Cyanobacteria bacterium J06638_28]